MPATQQMPHGPPRSRSGWSDQMGGTVIAASSNPASTPGSPPHEPQPHRHQLPSGKPAQLGSLESQVMEVLWNGDSLTIREVINRLPKPSAYTTIATVLGNLHKKDLVCSRKEGHSTRYFACVLPQEYAAHVMRYVLEHSPNPQACIENFIDNLRPADLDILCDVIRKQRGIYAL